MDPAIEDEANGLCERLYKGEITVQGLIDILKTLNASEDSRERSVYLCVISSLIDEYQFFSNYPEKELSLTANLFGSIIQHRLMPPSMLLVALKLVLQSLMLYEAGHKMSNFGLQALKQFASSLREWPPYCEQLLQVAYLEQRDPELYRCINEALKQQQQQQHQEEGADNNAFVANTTTATSKDVTAITTAPPPFTAIHVPDIPEPEDQDVKYEMPPEDIRDKILFIINNIARDNFETKSAALKEALTVSAYHWFSDYLVVKRASSEPNYHELYILLLEALDSKLLYRHVLRETFANIKILINSDRTISSSTERGLLKNLGAWLGGLTLARDKPIKHKYISFKDLLLEGYDSNRLIVVIPFVCKVLEQGSRSKIFKPPNPWLMAMLKLLAELYQEADLKLNLKFEIEVLCKSLSIELSSIEASSSLKNRPPKQTQPELGKETSSDTTMLKQTDSAYVGDTAAVANIEVPNIAPYVMFNPQINLFETNPSVKTAAIQALTQCIREMIVQLSERPVRIAVSTTVDIVSKDFALEPDEMKMRSAAHKMVSGLISSYAVVSCQELLESSLIANLREAFVPQNYTQVVSERLATVIAADNYSLVYATIVRLITEIAINQVDQGLADAYANRQKHRSQRPDQPYVDPEYHAMDMYVSKLPLPLRITTHGVQAGHMRIYDDFARMAQTRLGLNGATNYTDQMARAAWSNAPASYLDAATGQRIDRSRLDPKQQIPSEVLLSNQQQLMEKGIHYLLELDAMANQIHLPNIDSLPPQHEIRHGSRQLIAFIASSFDRAEAALQFAQRIVNLLYNSETQVAIEMHVILLNHLCEALPEVASVVVPWLTKVNHERKFVVPISVTLIKAGLINVPEHDQELAMLIEQGVRATNDYAVQGGRATIDYAARLVQACLFSDPPLATHQDFAACLECFARMRGANIPESVALLLDELRQRAAIQRDDRQAVIRAQFHSLFSEWVKRCRHPSANEKTQSLLLSQIFQQNIFGDPEMVTLFFRVALETSVEHASRCLTSKADSAEVAYYPSDALANLIAGYLQMMEVDKTGNNNSNTEAYEYTKALSVMIVVIGHYHEVRQQQFDQRPFLRVFTGIFDELHRMPEKMSFPALCAVSNILYVIQPKHFPGFTFAWFQLISHRHFMSKLLLAEDRKGWPVFHRLLACGLQFTEPFLKDTELRDTTRMLYKGVLRLLLVLLHDFPEFLCCYHYSLCDAIPSSCIQLRNLVLSAFPRNMRLPDPFMDDLKVDLLEEIQEPPRILSDYTTALKPNDFGKQIEEYLESKKPENFPTEAMKRFRLPGDGYDEPVINAFVFHIGLRGMKEPVSSIAYTNHFQLISVVLAKLDPEGRYLLLNAIANHLRYPNSHTHYFSCLMLALFSDTQDVFIKEQITRVLLERLIVARPHPWGLLITFIELMKNSNYQFWGYDFIKRARDIERLFENVSRRLF